MMEKETTKEVQEETFGKILHDERLKKGKTLRDVANELCIRRVYLEAIEKMEFDKLPPAPYGGGFVRSYAQYVGLNADRMMALFKQLTNPDNASQKHDGEKINVSATSPKIWHILLGLLGLFLLIFAWKYLNVENNVMTTEEEQVSTQSVPVFEPVILPNDENVSETTDDETAAEPEINNETEQNTAPQEDEKKSKS
ncbi:MAG: helix-turn-helix domain-containing protein [Alphaproteobacteria bacterium]|nr:helix-turn-helix domain-containing protein [Alphaproteobacteria bacterium]